VRKISLLFWKKLIFGDPCSAPRTIANENQFSWNVEEDHSFTPRPPPHDRSGVNNS
jgi:hypothetical protein